MEGGTQIAWLARSAVACGMECARKMHQCAQWGEGEWQGGRGSQER
jgi:hypothetical protein